MENYEKLLTEVFSQQYFAVLNTIGDNIPYSNLISYAITEDFRTLVFLTKRDTRKYQNILFNHNISILVDNRSNEPSDIQDAVAITLSGFATEASDQDILLKALFETRHPYLRPFSNDPGTVLITVNIHEIIIAGFTHTQTIRIS